MHSAIFHFFQNQVFKTGYALFLNCLKSGVTLFLNQFKIRFLTFSKSGVDKTRKQRYY